MIIRNVKLKSEDLNSLLTYFDRELNSEEIIMKKLISPVIVGDDYNLIQVTNDDVDYIVDKLKILKNKTDPNNYDEINNLISVFSKQKSDVRDVDFDIFPDKIVKENEPSDLQHGFRVEPAGNGGWLVISLTLAEKDLPGQLLGAFTNSEDLLKFLTYEIGK